MKQWNLKISEDRTRGGQPEFLGIYWKSWKNNISEQEILLRFVCHILVEIIPSRGLSELYETLTDIHKFYLPQLEQESLLLSQPQQIKAEYGTRSVRPEFPLVYDEE